MSVLYCCDCVCVRNSVIITVINVTMTLLGGCALFVALGAELLLDITDIRQLDMSGEHTANGSSSRDQSLSKCSYK